MQLNDFYYLGKITKKFSFRGEVIIFLDTDSPKFYYNIKKIFIKINHVLTPFNITSVKPNKTNRIRVKINGIDTENDSEKLINKEIYLPLESLPAPLPRRLAATSDFLSTLVEPLGSLFVETGLASDLAVA